MMSNLNAALETFRKQQAQQAEGAKQDADQAKVYECPRLTTAHLGVHVRELLGASTDPAWGKSLCVHFASAKLKLLLFIQKKPRKSTKTKGPGSTGPGRGHASAAAKGRNHEAGIRQIVAVKGTVSLGKQLKVIVAKASPGLDIL